MSKLPCPPELWPAFSVLLDEALELPEHGRPKWLASLGREHAAVRPWLQKVFAGASATAGTAESRFLVKGPSMDDPSLSEFRESQHIGPYRLKERLGSGGMGEVWLAVRSDGSLNRDVALKLPHSHLLAGVLRRRFERERDILAGLSHPHIAQLYDAGVADAQHPYLAMELVDGVPINEHCRDAKLSLEQRLELFLQILEAVGYAHGRLIAHRDLKPSNILVTREGQVKLLDFGIAKLLDGDAEKGATQLTKVGNCMATPGYAAPEQLAGDPVTVAVDLYALGVILHELLTGQRPLRAAGKNTDKLNDAARASSRIDEKHPVTVGGLTTKQLRRALAGDLDAIIAKALESDPLRRYRSAEAFALDLELSRAHRPISALHISATTVTLKFMRRHRVGAAMTAALLLTLIGGSGGVAWYAVRAEREAQRATTIKDFLIGVFRASDPRIAADKPRGEITARELLDVSAKQIENGFARQPETQIELLGVTADIYGELEEVERSDALYARETELARNQNGDDDVHVIEGLLGEANNADRNGDHARTFALLTQADPLIHRAHLDRSPIRARWLLMRGEALYDELSKADETQAALEAAADLFQATAPQDPRYPSAWTDLGSLAYDRTQYLRSVVYYRKAIATSHLSSQVEALLTAYVGLAVASKDLGDFDEATEAFKRGAELTERTYGRDSRQYWMIESDRGRFRYERGERQAGLAALAALRQSLPNTAKPYQSAMNGLEAAKVLLRYGHCLAIDGEGPRAVENLEQAQTLLLQSAPRGVDIGRMKVELGNAYAAAGRPADARVAFSSGLSDFRSQRAPAAILANALDQWGRFLITQQDPYAAREAFAEVLRLAAGHSTESAVGALSGLASSAVLNRDARTALEYSKYAMDRLDRIEGYFDVRIKSRVWAVRAQSLLLGGFTAEARELADRTLGAVMREYGSTSSQVVEAQSLVRESENRFVKTST